MPKDVKYVISLQDLFSKKINTAKKSVSAFDNSVTAVGKSMLRIGAGALSFAAVGAAVVSSVKKIADFEEQVSNLSAITGATGEDLDFLSKKAIQMGGATTKSAMETIEAFKLIASAKPELLSNAAALAKVTEEAITLSEASGLALPDAARNLAETLNQFSAGADQASRFINVLAAGSKLSAAEIPDVAMAIKEFGVNAKDANISIEQSVALIETLAEKGVKGQRSGMQLRNVLLKLASSTDKKINPEFTDLNTVLDNLAKKQLSTAELTKMFGRQNIIAAKTLIQSRNRVSELSIALKDTNIAYEQAAVNTDNLNSDIKRLDSSWEKFILNLNQGSGAISKSLRTATQGLANFIDKLDFANKTEGERGELASDRAKDRLREALMGEKNQDRVKSAIIEQIYLEKKLKKESGKRIAELEGFKTTLAGSILTGSGELLAEKNLELAFEKGAESTIKELTSLISDTGKFAKFFESLRVAPVAPPPGVITPGAELKDAVTTISAAAPKTFNINVGNIVEKFTITTENITDTAVNVRDKITEAFGLALADLQTIAE